MKCAYNDKDYKHNKTTLFLCTVELWPYLKIASIFDDIDNLNNFCEVYAMCVHLWFKLHYNALILFVLLLQYNGCRLKK